MAISEWEFEYFRHGYHLCYNWEFLIEFVYFYGMCHPIMAFYLN